MAATGPTPRRKPVTIDRTNVRDFMEQIDAVVSDCDGVLWGLDRKPIGNAAEGLKSLKAAGKKIMFASNNSIDPPNEKLENIGVTFDENDIVHPALATARHLQQLGFKKKAFVLATERFRDEIRAVGVKVVPERTGVLMEENVQHFLRLLSIEDPEIGAVIIDHDMNINYLDFSRAVNYLRNPDCLFLAGATETKIIAKGKIFPGCGLWLQIIEDLTGRKPKVIGKPGPMMVTEYLKDLNNLNLERSIFVGDIESAEMIRDYPWLVGILLDLAKFCIGLEDFPTNTNHPQGSLNDHPARSCVTIFEVMQEVHKPDLRRFLGCRLDQDMGIANACGMKKLLVLSGVTQLKDLDTCDPELLPDFIIEAIEDFADLLSERQE